MDTKKSFLEIGSGAGRTTQTILSLVDNVKYVIADIPPALNLSYKNIKEMFPEKGMTLEIKPVWDMGKKRGRPRNYNRIEQ